VDETNIQSKVVLPVFFRKADACIVTRQVYNLTTELNPQLNNELVIISRKENLIPGVIAVDSRLSREFKNKITHAFVNMLKSVEGKQLLMLFKVNDLIPFDPSYLKGTEALYAEHTKLFSRRN
jgi:ABC-type phosphate/phosphonate transport system substrate-binding protein